jgi:hypothetical protein
MAYMPKKSETIDVAGGRNYLGVEAHPALVEDWNAFNEVEGYKKVRSVAAALRLFMACPPSIRLAVIQHCQEPVDLADKAELVSWLDRHWDRDGTAADDLDLSPAGRAKRLREASKPRRPGRAGKQSG